MRIILAILAPFFWLLASAQPGQIVSVEINKLNSIIINPQPNFFHLGFPRIIRLPNDSLMIAYRKGNSHVDLAGRLVKQFGSPDGLVWGVEELLYNDTTTDDRHACMTVLPDQSIGMHFYKNKLPNNTIYPPIPQFSSTYFSRSFDNGKTFDIPFSLDDCPLELPSVNTWNGSVYLDSNSVPLQSIASNAPGIMIGSRYVIPAYGGESPTYLTASQCFGSAIQRISFFETDDYINWSHRIINESTLPNSWLLEPSILKMDNDKILLHFRSSDTLCTAGKAGPLRQAISSDDGQTFQNYTDFPFVGHAPMIYKLSSGVLLSGFRWVTNNITSQKTAFVYSINNGLNWSDTILVAEPNFDSGYPDFVELDNTTFMVVYYDAYGSAIRGVRFNINITYMINLDIPEESLFTEEQLSLFPNPNNGIINLSLAKSADGNNRLRVISQSGSVVVEQNVETYGSKFEQTFDFQSLSDGIYFIEFTSKEYSYKKRFIISR